jgi:lysophospholipase L1-like esterase
MKRIILSLALVLSACADTPSAPAPAPPPLPDFDPGSVRREALVTASDWSPCPLPSAGKCAIMSMGDSHTVGGKVKATPCESTCVPGAYRTRTEQLLTAAGRSFDFVGNDIIGPTDSLYDREFSAMPGYTLNQLRSYTSTPVRAYKPRAMIALGGANDAAQAVTQAWMEYYFKNWRLDLLTGAAWAPGTRPPVIVWITIPKFCADPVVDARITTFNTWMVGYLTQLINAALNDPNKGPAYVTDAVADVRGLLDCSLHYAPDLIHLNQLGQDVVGDAVYAQLTDPARPIVP